MAYISGYQNYANSASNRIYGDSMNTFKNWECYMLLKYGKPGNFNVSGENQYLIELPLYPDQVTESISASWNTQAVLGRSSPIAAYANTDLKSVNFSIDLHRDLMTGSHSLTMSELNSIRNASKSKQAAGLQWQSDTGPFNTRKWYVNINKMLQMSCYPQYTQSGLVPPTTYFVFGQMILKGFVNSYQTDWKKPILNTFYGWNTVSIQMYCYPDSIISAKDIIDNHGAMSTQNTYNTKFPTGSAVNSNVMTRNFSRDNLRGSGALGGNVLQT